MTAEPTRSDLVADRPQLPWDPDTITVGPDYDPAEHPEGPSAEEIERLADEAERGYDLDDTTLVYRRPRGRPSLTGQATASPQIRVRVSDDLRHRAIERAEREGRTLSDVTREALERYLVG